MACGFRTEVLLPDERETARFGAALAGNLAPGDTLLLSGPIGAGKTHLARSIVQTRLAAAGRLEDVPSPTFTLVQVYDDDISEIWHADLYRLTGPGEAMELGLDEAFESAIVLVEWPDRLGDAAPHSALSIDMRPEGGARRAMLSSASEKWRNIVPVTGVADG